MISGHVAQCLIYIPSDRHYTTLEKTDFPLATRNQLQTVFVRYGNLCPLHSASTQTLFPSNLCGSCVCCHHLWVHACINPVLSESHCSVGVMYHPGSYNPIFLPLLLHRPLRHKGRGFMKASHLRISDPKSFTMYIVLFVRLCVNSYYTARRSFFDEVWTRHWYTGICH